MNIFDSEPCDDNLQKFRITCGEVYILTNIIELSKKLHSIDLIDSGKLDLNKFFYKHQFYYNLSSHDLYFLGIKNKNFLFQFKLFNNEIFKKSKISKYPVSLSLIFRLLKKYVKLVLRTILIR